MTTELTFQAGAYLLPSSIQPPVGISFDVPITEEFNQRKEGYVSLGLVPNHEELVSTLIETDNEEFRIKEEGEDFFTLPKGAELLRPAVQLAAAYELAHSSLFVEKSATLIVRDHLFFETKKAPEYHRDPPNPAVGSIQNVYSFASDQPTEFLHDRRPQPFEMSCFTSGAPHRIPEIQGGSQSDPLRRLFVAITFCAAGTSDAMRRLNWRPITGGPKPFDPYAQFGAGWDARSPSG